DQQVRGARPGLVLEGHQPRRAHRPPLRRPGALGNGRRPRGCRAGAGDQDDRASTRSGRAVLMLVSEAVGTVLARLGADTVFGVVGSGNFHVTNALIAGGWARTAGRPGILSVHQGPGVTNALTGITEAAKSRTPLLVLAADVAASATTCCSRCRSMCRPASAPLR